MPLPAARQAGEAVFWSVAKPACGNCGPCYNPPRFGLTARIRREIVRLSAARGWDRPISSPIQGPHDRKPLLVELCAGGGPGGGRFHLALATAARAGTG